MIILYQEPWSGKARTTTPTSAHILNSAQLLTLEKNFESMSSNHLSLPSYTICVHMPNAQAVNVCDRRYCNALRYVLILQAQRDNW